mmetsp:Transcript_13409/g.43688  ORF Transcript_13409/g.43688 Transcript_13409/m.43688 type:complete len:271 (-) Transcript_13409:483-1295(-)
MAEVVRQLDVEGKRVLDLCAGSGVLGLVALAEGAASCLGVEVDPRAADFAEFNAKLNDLDARYDVKRAAVADFVVSLDREDDDDQGKDRAFFDVILANPPYVAVPEALQYDRFADGGPTGEAVLEDIVKVASRALRDDGGLLAVVLEVNGDPRELLGRVTRWFGDRHVRCAVVVDDLDRRRHHAEHVARRRGGGSAAAEDVWLGNLRAHGISSVRNGFLFATTLSSSGEEESSAESVVIEVPRVWAPGRRVVSVLPTSLFPRVEESSAPR